MNQKPLRNMYLHYRFKFLAVTSIAFLIYILLTCPTDMESLVASPQFKLLGPFFIVVGILFLLFRRKYGKCPYCRKPVLLMKNWRCPECSNLQNKERFLIDKCVHCKSLMSTWVCEHCKEEFML